MTAATGLTGTFVTTVRAPGSDVVTMCVAVHSGAADDPDHLPGLAHLLEHLASLGPSRGAAGQVGGAGVGALVAHGGRRNAVTLGELTLFTATVPRSAEVGAVLDDELSRLGAADVCRDDLLRESEVIALEAAGSAPTGAARILWSLLPARALDVSEPRVSGMGDATRLAAADLDEVTSTLRRRYRADRASAVVVGDVATRSPGPQQDPVAAPNHRDTDVPLERSTPRPVGLLDVREGRLRGAVSLPVPPATADPCRYLALLVLCRLLRRLGAGVHAAFVGHEGRWWASRHHDVVTIALFDHDGLTAVRRDLGGRWSAHDLHHAHAATALDLGRSVESTALRAQQVATWDALVDRTGPVRDLIARPGPLRTSQVSALVDESLCRSVAADLLDSLDRAALDVAVAP